MGNSCRTDKISTSNYGDFCPLRIATLYADIDESINKRKKIDTIVEYFMRPYYGYNLDILCIQGIRNYKILKEIILAFKKRLEQYNDDNRAWFGKTIYLEYYPDIDSDKLHDNDLYWSTSESDNEIHYYDKLIVSRHNILQSANVHIGTNKSDYDTNDNTNFLRPNNNDSDDISNIYKYVQVVNLNIDGTFLSLYNIELEDDSIGISNNKERGKQIQEIKKIIDCNRKKFVEARMRQFVHGDNTYIASNRDLHIITGMFHINEIKNGSLNTEYNRTLHTLNSLDTHKWVAALRKETLPTTTNTRFTKDIYTMLVSQNLMAYQDISIKSQKLFEEHKTVIISSNITKNHVDMNQFTNYPEDTVFMLYKPNIKQFSDKKIEGNKNSHDLFNNPPNNQSNGTTKFMDQKNHSVANDSNVHFTYRANTHVNKNSEPLSRGPRMKPTQTTTYRNNTLNSNQKMNMNQLLNPASDQTMKPKSGQTLHCAEIQSQAEIKLDDKKNLKHTPSHKSTDSRNSQDVSLLQRLAIDTRNGPTNDQDHGAENHDVEYHDDNNSDDDVANKEILFMMNKHKMSQSSLPRQATTLSHISSTPVGRNVGLSRQTDPITTATSPAPVILNPGIPLINNN
jgi:hypothetical protein